ncbi:FecR domain-containing protein [Undibacterium fentianense]|uniref:FecR domain-containing protein n=1 Tax=Undibacterium fentianense TaxID=2828728 RepID=A0A941E600_9BURK|nr:FecR domain-containing protein [Undibacterium fentianense]MBR7801717.1 FecR domain-containing protein [Undibacterium fentianense]
MKCISSQAAKSYFASLFFLATIITSNPASAQVFKGSAGSLTIKAGEITFYPSENTTLSEIAAQFTQNPNNWQAIAKHNKLKTNQTMGIGSSIAIPSELLPEEPSQATVIAMAGEVMEIKKNGSESNLAMGNVVQEGSQLKTGKNGFLTLSLPDNSRISIPSNSQVAIAKLRMAKYTRSPRTEIRLVQGKVESKVSPLSSNRGRFEVTSPLAIAGVRGTHFRVGVNENGIGNEVLEGGVAVGQQEKPNALVLPAGQGNIINKTGVGNPVALLQAPNLKTDYLLQERPALHFTVDSIPEAARYRAQISLDMSAQNIIAESYSQENRFKFDGIADGNYFIRLTAIDKNNLEGMPYVTAFKHKANPIPPFTLQPKKKVRSETLEFLWTESSEAKSYHLQIAKDPSFQQIVTDQANLKQTSFYTSQLPFGDYFWRVATVTETNGKPDQGPFSVPDAFTTLAPQTMNTFADSGSDQLEFSWPGEAGQTYEVQVADEPSFKLPILNQQSKQANLSMARPAPGEYFIRVRATDADGFVGQFCKPQKFEIHMRWMTGSGELLNSAGGTVRPNKP